MTNKLQNRYLPTSSTTADGYISWPRWRWAEPVANEVEVAGKPVLCGDLSADALGISNHEAGSSSVRRERCHEMRIYNTQHTHYCSVDLHARSLFVNIHDDKEVTLLEQDIPALPAAIATGESVAAP